MVNKQCDELLQIVAESHEFFVTFQLDVNTADARTETQITSHIHVILIIKHTCHPWVCMGRGSEQKWIHNVFVVRRGERGSKTWG